VRSSPASADSSLELPPVTAADLAAGAIVALATAFLAWAIVRSGWSMTASLLLSLAGSAIVAIRVRSWVRSTCQPARRLVACPDGSLWLHTVGQPPCRATLGPGTRLIGPSVFLDLLADSNRAGERLRSWLTPFDVPASAIRRCSVVLRRSGRVTSS
jgi:hypothetical protein